MLILSHKLLLFGLKTAKNGNRVHQNYDRKRINDDDAPTSLKKNDCAMTICPSALTTLGGGWLAELLLHVLHAADKKV